MSTSEIYFDPMWDIRMTDTSLRDGSHHKRHQFTKDEVGAIVAALDKAERGLATTKGAVLSTAALQKRFAEVKCVARKMALVGEGAGTDGLGGLLLGELYGAVMVPASASPSLNKQTNSKIHSQPSWRAKSASGSTTARLIQTAALASAPSPANAGSCGAGGSRITKQQTTPMTISAAMAR